MRRHLTSPDVGPLEQVGVMALRTPNGFTTRVLSFPLIVQHETAWAAEIYLAFELGLYLPRF